MFSRCAIRCLRNILTSTSSSAAVLRLPCPRLATKLQLRLIHTKAPAKESVEEWLRSRQISRLGERIPDPIFTLEEARWPEWIKKYLIHNGAQNPTDIQAVTWSVALQNRDMIGIAKTGSGKTLGFILPSLMMLQAKESNGSSGPSVLVVSPTRELAQQIATVFTDIVAFPGSPQYRIDCFTGGNGNKGQQMRDFPSLDILVATPGRLNDLVETMRQYSRDSPLANVSYLVFDEADRMLDMGFMPQIQAFIAEIPRNRQTLMWSATWPTEVQSLAKELLKNPIQVNVGSTELSANPDIEQHFIVASSFQEKLQEVLKIFQRHPKAKTLIFCNTKVDCEMLQRALRGNGHMAGYMHSGVPQIQRDLTLGDFRELEGVTLVATDVAARGIDVRDIDFVLNFGLPNEVENYVHRIGRTGRAGKKGTSITLLCDEDSETVVLKLKALLKRSNVPIPDALARVMGTPTSTKGKGASKNRAARGSSFGVASQEWSSEYSPRKDPVTSEAWQRPQGYAKGGQAPPSNYEPATRRATYGWKRAGARSSPAPI